jgi:hypothetical protein
MDLREEVGERDPPAWAAEPIAWASCLATAVLPTAVLDVVFRTLKTPMPDSATFGLYLCAFTLLAWTVKPWSARS